MTTAARPPQGVTADSIKVVVYIGDPAKNPLQAASVRSAGADVSPTPPKETYQGYFDLFAKYYETYGRKIDLQFFDGTGGPMDEVAARADAKAIADMKPFAVLNGANQTPAWSDELAANGIMCLGNCSLAVPAERSSRSTRRTSSASARRPSRPASSPRASSPSCSRARRPSSRATR